VLAKDHNQKEHQFHDQEFSIIQTKLNFVIEKKTKSITLITD
jgi:hypothetical protein